MYFGTFSVVNIKLFFGFFSFFLFSFFVFFLKGQGFHSIAWLGWSTSRELIAGFSHAYKIPLRKRKNRKRPSNLFADKQTLRRTIEMPRILSGSTFTNIKFGRLVGKSKQTHRREKQIRGINLFWNANHIIFAYGPSQLSWILSTRIKGCKGTNIGCFFVLKFYTFYIVRSVSLWYLLISYPWSPSWELKDSLCPSNHLEHILPLRFASPRVRDRTKKQSCALHGTQKALFFFSMHVSVQSLPRFQIANPPFFLKKNFA